MPSTLSQAAMFSPSKLPAAPTWNTAPGTGGPCTCHKGTANSGSISNKYLTTTGPGHRSSRRATEQASNPAHGIAKVSARLKVGIDPTNSCQAAVGNPLASTGKFPASHAGHAICAPEPVALPAQPSMANQASLDPNCCMPTLTSMWQPCKQPVRCTQICPKWMRFYLPRTTVS